MLNRDEITIVCFKKNIVFESHYAWKECQECLIDDCFNKHCGFFPDKEVAEAAIMKVRLNDIEREAREHFDGKKIKT